jgi:hypothetical protein
MIASRVFSYLGITGIFFPWTGEPNVNADVPDPDLPFAIAHEMAHARGFAREDEAGYVGYLACRFHPDPDFRYSGVLSASIYALNALGGVDRASYRELADRRSPAVRRDLRALQEWGDRYSGRLSRASRSGQQRVPPLPGTGRGRAQLRPHGGPPGRGAAGAAFGPRGP